MSENSKIGWTDATWNPVRGCSKVSAGCRHCYAETFAERWRGIPGHPFEQGFDVRLVPEKLEEPLKWKKPKRIFVNSMSDLFHKDVPDEYIARVMNVVRMCDARDYGHTFQVLTKRADRMAYLMPRLRFDSEGAGRVWFADSPDAPGYPLAAGHRGATGLQNLWLGVSVEDQRAADERIPLLLQTPAAVRFLSCEPLLEHVNLRRITPETDELGVGYDALAGALCGNREPGGPRISWVICGGESGHGARPMRLEWARSLRDQCRDAGVPFFLKQLGGSRDKGEDLESIPEDLRIRQFPA